MLAGKVALITGACGDIGSAIAEALAQNGAKIVANDRCEPAEAQDILKRIEERSSGGFYFKADVSKRTEVKSMVDEAVKRFGRLDICVANAAVVAPASFLEITNEDWLYHLNINLSGCFYVSQEAARVMADRQIPGKIVFTSSWSAGCAI